jgi:putative membrane protein
MSTSGFARNHVPALTAVLTIVSLALVFSAVLGFVPALPRAPEAVIDAIPHLNAVISAVAIVTIALGWRAIRNGAIKRHRALMVTSAVLFGTFLILYLYRVALEGPQPFGGPAMLYRWVYTPILAIHILLAIVCVPLVYYVVLLAGTRPIEAIPETAHPRVGQLAASLWLVSFALGIVVYLLLYVLF